MPYYFWSNTIWFVILGISAVAQVIFALIKAKRWKFGLAFYLAICGLCFSVEASICCFFKSYNYYPMIFLKSPYDDNIAGNLFSQFTIASTALLIAVLGLRNYWILIFAGIYGLIEELFLRLGIFRHNWYKTWITVIGLIIIFWIVKKIYRKASISLNPVLRYFLIFFGLYTLDLPIIKWIFTLNGIFLINMKLLHDELSSYALTFLSNLFIIGIVCIVIRFSRIKWWLKALLFFALFGLSYVANSVNLYGIKEGWFLIFSSADIFGTYLFVYILDKLFGRQARYGSTRAFPTLVFLH